MIILPKEILHIIQTIEAAGFEAYAVGGCVRDTILGRHPEDWDLTSNASRDILEALFPEAAIVNRKLGVMRIAQNGIAADVAAYRIDGEYRDYRRPETVTFTEEIGEDLKRRDFTMNAIAVNPARGIVDPYHGREDIQRKTIRGIGDPCVRFEEDALRILRAVRFSAQLGFEIEAETLRAMKEKASLLRFISVERIREEFFKTAAAGNAGAGLALLKETGVLVYLLGEECINNAGDSEWRKFDSLVRSIDLAQNTLNLRLALVYRCFEMERAMNAIDRLGYSNQMKKLLQRAVSLTDELVQIRSKAELKGFIARVGTETFLFLTDLWKQQCTVSQTGESDLQSTLALLDEIKSRREPVFPEDLAVDGNDLIGAGVREGAAVGSILRFLLETVHREPQKNEMEQLLKIAKCMRRKEC